MMMMMMMMMDDVLSASGIETWGSGGSMNRGPKAPEGPELQLLLLE